jgi:5-methylcytosine-specific restriction endonuclease McrA
VRDVLLLNATYEPLAVVDARRAVVLLIGDKAEMIEADAADRAMRSPSLSVPLPAVVRLRRRVHPPRRSRLPLNRTGVLLRDGYECAYCTDRWADTVDHVVPRSRGGRHEWRNVVACCQQCNRHKGDRLVGELGWRLRFQPTVPSGEGSLVVRGTAPEWTPYLPRVA